MKKIILLSIALSATANASFVTPMETDADCLTSAVYFEARNQPEVGQVAVASVVMNRVYSERYPDSICEVVKQKWAFSFYWDGQPETVKDLPAWSEAQRMAMIATLSPWDITEGATLYHTTVIKPNWNYTKAIETVTMSDHIFYKEI